MKPPTYLTSVNNPGNWLPQRWPFAALLSIIISISAFADIRVDTSGTTLTLDATTAISGNIVSGGSGTTAATGNKVELLGERGGNVSSHIIGATGIPDSGFESLKMAGVSWTLTGSIALTGTGAQTLHVSSGKLTVAGVVGPANVTAGAYGATIDSGATLQIGNGGGGQAFGLNINNNGTLIFATNNTNTFVRNITGSGAVAKNNSNALTLSGSNSYSGGTLLTLGSLRADNGFAFGTGDIRITSGDLWYLPTPNGSIEVANKITATGGRVIARMATTGTIVVGGVSQTISSDVFSFAASAAVEFNATVTAANFIAQRGTYNLSGATAASLRNASIRFDGRSTDGTAIINVGAGEQKLRRLELMGPIMVFDLDMSGTNLVPKGTIAIDENFTIGNRIAEIRLSATAALPVYPVADPAGKPLLAMDDASVPIGKLMSWGGVFTGNFGNLLLLDQDGNPFTASEHAFDLTQSGTVYAKAIYNYRLNLGSAVDSLWLSYGLAKIEMQNGIPLVLSGDTDAQGASDMTAMITGSSDLIIRATKKITLANPVSTYTGKTIVETGTLSFGSHIATGSTSLLDVKPQAVVDLNNTNQSVKALSLPAGSRVDFNMGELTVGTGTIAANTMSGFGTLRVAANGKILIQGDNPDFIAAVVAAAGATLELQTAGALGGSSSGPALYSAPVTLEATTSKLNITGAAGGTFYNRVSGSGAFTVTSSTLALANAVSSNTVDIKNSDVTAMHGSALGSGAASKTTVDANSTVRLGVGGWHTVNNLVLTNSRIVYNPQSANAEQRNAYLKIGALSGSGTFVMNADLGRLGSSDLVQLTGTTNSGSYVLSVKPTGQANPDVASRLVAAAKVSDLALFSLENGAIESGGYTYTLIKGDAASGGMLMDDPNSLYLATAGHLPSSAAQAIIATACVSGMEWQYSLDTLTSRMGDLRTAIKAAGENYRGGLWTRGNAYELRADRDLGGVAFDETVWGINAGIDKAFRSATATTLAGVFLGANYVDRDFDNRGSGSTNGTSVGLYLTRLLDSGWFGDLVLKADINKNKFSAIAIDGSISGGRYTSEAQGASLEIGRQLSLGKSFWIEPGIQAAIAHLGADEYESDNGIQVFIDDATASQLRGQVRFGWHREGARFQPYGRIGGVYSTMSGGQVRAASHVREPDFDGTRLELGAGGAYTLSPRSQVYCEYEYAKAAAYERRWSLSLGWRWGW